MNEWLVLVNVQSRARNFARFQCGHQCGFVDYWPARRVDKECRRLHAIKLRRVKQSPRLRQQRHVHAYKVGFRQQRIHLPKFRV